LDEETVRARQEERHVKLGIAGMQELVRVSIPQEELIPSLGMPRSVAVHPTAHLVDDVLVLDYLPLLLFFIKSTVI
jgi:hypothetical protein